MKVYPDKYNHVKSYHLTHADCMLVKQQQRQNKLSSHYDKMPYKISDKRYYGGRNSTKSPYSNQKFLFLPKDSRNIIPLQIEEEEEMDDTMANQHPLQVNQPPQLINQKSLTVNQPPKLNRCYPTRQNRCQPARLADSCLG